MPTKKCGDKVNLTMTFESPLKKELAIVLISRKDLMPSHKADFIIEGSDIKIPYPDVMPENSWCGGVQAYFVGLDEDWDKRWDMQEFEIEVTVGNKVKKSGEPLIIERFPNSKTSPYESSIMLQRSEPYTFRILEDTGITRVIESYREKGRPFRKTSKFDIELKNNEIILTSKVDWDFALNYVANVNDKKNVKWIYENFSPSERVKLFEEFKENFPKKVEGHWNSELDRFQLHRKKCVRGNDCNCQLGCCKFGLRVKIEDGSYNRVTVVLGRGRAWSNRFYTMQSRPSSWVHEFGHHLGLPDEYIGGHLAATPGSQFVPDSNDSIMGRGGTVKRGHVEHIVAKWIKDALGEDFEVVELK